MTTLPLRIENGSGEVLTFEQRVATPEGERLETTYEVRPGADPPMHIRYRQEEALTVAAGRLGYRIEGEVPRFAVPAGSRTHAANLLHLAAY